MKLSLAPETQRFIDEQVRSGRYPTAEALVEAAVADFRDNYDAPVDDATTAAINEAEDQADRGEGTDLETFRAKMNERIAGRR